MNNRKLNYMRFIVYARKFDTGVGLTWQSENIPMHLLLTTQWLVRPISYVLKYFSNLFYNRRWQNYNMQFYDI